jgi:hypothetical protein
LSILLDVSADSMDDVYPRKVGEAISFSFGAMANLVQYPLGEIPPFADGCSL